MSLIKSSRETMLLELTENILNSSVNLKKLSESPQIINAVLDAVEMIVHSYKNGGCLYVAGNGGSAADAQHLVAELISKLCRNRTPIRGYALTTDTSVLTAIGNDYGYEFVFSRQVEANMKNDDVFLAISTSGNSLNILKALEATKKIGAKSILLSGKDGGSAKSLADINIISSGDNTAQIQEAHITIYHNMCHLIESALVKAELCRYL